MKTMMMAQTECNVFTRRRNLNVHPERQQQQHQRRRRLSVDRGRRAAPPIDTCCWRRQSWPRLLSANTDNTPPGSDEWRAKALIARRSSSAEWAASQRADVPALGRRSAYSYPPLLDINTTNATIAELYLAANLVPRKPSAVLQLVASDRDLPASAAE